MPIPQERRYNIEEFEQLLEQPENSQRLLELIDGEIVEKMPTEEQGETTALIAAALNAFVRPNKLGRVGVDVRHRIPQDDQNVRLPDVSFIAGNRPRVTEGSVPQMPDLVIAVKSRRDLLQEYFDRAHYYLHNGTKLLWIFVPVKRFAIAITAEDEQILLAHELLDGGDVLPGFSLPLKDIFDDPLEQ